MDQNDRRAQPQNSTVGTKLKLSTNSDLYEYYIPVSGTLRTRRREQGGWTLEGEHRSHHYEV
jgi:hypothetical protein